MSKYLCPYPSSSPLPALQGVSSVLWQTKVKVSAKNTARLANTNYIVCSRVQVGRGVEAVVCGVQGMP